jgi:DNA polymerase-3 subunit beta
VKFAADAGALARALLLIALGVKRTAIAGLGAVRIEATGDTVSFAGTDLHVAVTATAAATILDPGKAAVAADRIAALVGGFSALATIEIGTTDRGINGMQIVSGNSRSRLPIVPWADLPNLLAIDDAIATLEISGSDALILLEPMSAAATQQAQFYLRGTVWQTVGDTLTSIGTNGTTFIKTSIAAETFSPDLDLIVPRETGAVLSRLIKVTRPIRVTLTRSKGLLAVTSDTFHFVARLINGKYPDCTRIVPPPSSNAVTCARGELLASLERLAAVALDDPLLMLSWSDPGQLNLSLARQPVNGSDMIDAETAGAAKAVVPLGQLADMLHEISGESVHLDVSDGRPLRIQGDGTKLALVSRCAWNFNGEKEEVH